MAGLEHNRGSPRLIFTREERESPELKKPVSEAEKAADRYEKARARLKPKRARDKDGTARESAAPEDGSPGPDADSEQAARSESAERSTGKPSTARERASGKAKHTASPHARASDAPPGPGAPPAGKTGTVSKPVRLRFDEELRRPPPKLRHPRVREAVGTELHRMAAKANRDENTAADAALKTEEGSETALRMGEHAYHAVRTRPYRAADRAEKALDRANIRFLDAKQRSEDPRFTANPFSRWQQKRAIRREYAAAKAGKTTAFETAAGSAEKAVNTAAERAKRAAAGVKKSPGLIIPIAILGGILILVMTGFQAITPLSQAVLESIAIGTYPATEQDVRKAEQAYAAKERELKQEMEHYETAHPGYDEYRVTSDEIGHDPYVLIAIISAYFDGEEWDIDRAYPVIEKYFKLQYIKTESIETQTRYRTETRHGTRIITDPDTGETRSERYTYDVQVPYAYTVCTANLENRDLSHMPVISMSHHTMGMYALYMGTHGNMEGIFAGNPNASPLRDPMLYDIPQQVLDSDPAFRHLMDEATKYIGYPYVWGGASPETSFDCSGFVSYVYTASGVCNIGRRGATGLCGMCREVTEAEARPGDLVFFEGTMGGKTPGVTHVGIYVGGGKMLHCGSPIGYADLSDHYWRTHFHSYGRLPY